ncbi:hypothetical protein C8J57DRAFT_1236680 [Mycena rebaudengoi]|nr:hypothetical protein C8J57DRAFT_1236680 [Mycena rebaudengoi]
MHRLLRLKRPPTTERGQFLPIMGKFAVGSDLDSRHFEMNPMPNVQSGEEACIPTTKRGQFLPIMGKFAVESYLESRIGLVREVFNPSTDKLGLLAECSATIKSYLRFPGNSDTLSKILPKHGATRPAETRAQVFLVSIASIKGARERIIFGDRSYNNKYLHTRSCGECGSPSGSSQPVVGKTFGWLEPADGSIDGIYRQTGQDSGRTYS